MASNQGQLHTLTSGFAPSGGAPGERKLDVSEKIFLLEPFNYPLVGLLTNIGKVTQDGGVSYQGQGMKKRMVQDPIFYSFEDAYGSTYEQLVAGPAVIDTTFTSADGSIYTAGDVLLLVDPAGVVADEQVVVTDRSGNTITIARGRDENNAGTGLNFSGGACDVFLLGNANQEGATSRTAIATTKSKVYNYCEIFKTSFEITATADKTAFYTGNQFKYQGWKQAVEHAFQIERQFWFGYRYEDTSGTKAKRFTGGVIEAIEASGSGAYTQDESSSVLTEAEFNTFLKDGFGNGSTSKLLFCSGTVLQAITNYARGALRIAPADKTYGVMINQYQSPFGTVNLIHNPLFKESYDGMAVLLDLDTIEYCVLNGRDTKLEMNIQTNDTDGRKDQFITECGLGRYNQQKNALLKGVTG